MLLCLCCHLCASFPTKVRLNLPPPLLLSTMITQSIHARLTALSESKKQTLQLIERLSKLKFQPGSTPLNDDEGDVRVELSSEIHESLKALEEELDLLRQEVEEISAASAAATVSARQRRDSERDREKARLSIQVARLGEDLRQYVSTCPTRARV